MPPEYRSGGFRCEDSGKDEIGQYLASGTAAHDQSVGFSRTYLVFLKSDAIQGIDIFSSSAPLPVAYYTLLADAIVLAKGERVPGVDYTTAPAIKIGRYGVRSDMRGKGVGKKIFRHIENEVLEIAQAVGVRFITLDSVADMIGFYKKLGFRFTEESQPATEADKAAGDRSMWYDLGNLTRRLQVSTEDADTGQLERNDMKSTDNTR
jgi:GNAT superfamily N-acetyltransferase